ncbi:MAG TPA: ATP-binding protein [Acidimicrobiia bacterium]|nr:ATP-binding protein [Acidimicrobiia bacterium]
MSRGKLKVFLGAAPGVGKTYAMLDEGRDLQSAGRDVVIGFVEAHGRGDTIAMSADLEVVPPRWIVAESEASVEEMDVEALLARCPEVALVDELAHTNAFGSKYPKRYQDVDVLLEAGIDVLTTVNIEHLESLNDVIFEITAVAQPDTIPDGVVRRADQIELVDLTQEGVRERLAAGKIFPAEQIDATLANYFRPGNLGALRELALSWTAERVDEAVTTYRTVHGIDRPWETRERVVVALAGTDGGEAVVRRAARLAMRSRADLVGVHVRPTRGVIQGSDIALTSQRDLLQRLGGRYHEVVGDDVGSSLLAFAKEENATQIVLGASRRSRVDEFIRSSPVARVIRDASDVDVHVISHEGMRRQRSSFRLPKKSPIGWSRRATAWAVAVLGLPLLTWLLLRRGERLELQNVLLVYLLVAVVTGAIGGALPAVVAAIGGFFLANWFFTTPVETFTIANPDQLLSLFAFLFVAATVGLLVGYSSRRSAEARTARAQAEALAATTTLAHPVFANDYEALLRSVRDALSLDAVSLVRRSADGWETLAWEGAVELKTPPDGSESIELAGDIVFVLRDGRLTSDDRIVLRAFVAQMVQAIEREELLREARAAEGMAETDRLRTALLSAVSHDLRTPLATIKASLTSLIETGVEWTPEQTLEFLNTALEETERLNRLVGHLLDASRLQANAVHVLFRPVGLDEVVASALAGLRSKTDRVTVDISESLPEVNTDPDLMERVIANLIENAVTWSPPDEMVRITAGEVQERIDLRIMDRGPGIPAASSDTIFQPFQRTGDSPDRDGVGLGLAVAKGLLEAMGNDLVIEDTPGGGTTMVIALAAASALDGVAHEGATIGG